MFEAKLTQSGVLRKIVDSIKDLCKEVNFLIDDDGFHMQSMDSSHVCLVSLELYCEEFTYFKCHQTQRIGVNLDHLAKILKCADPNDNVTLKTDPSQLDTLMMIFESENGVRISEMGLKLMNFDNEIMDLPESIPSATIYMSANEYQRIFRDLANVGESVLLSVYHDESGSDDEGSLQRDAISFRTTCDLGTVNIALLDTNSNNETKKEDDNDNVSIHIRELVQMSFGLRYLNSFSKASSFASQVYIGLLKNSPVEVKFNIYIDSDKHLGHIAFFLAPKIDEIEEEINST